MANRLIKDTELNISFSSLEENQRLALRVLYVCVDTPRFGVGMYIDTHGDIKISFVASSDGNPLDERVSKDNSVEFTSVKTVPLNMFNIAASLVSRAVAFTSEDRELISLRPNNPNIAAYIMFKE